MELRNITANDQASCATIMYEAFKSIAEKHGFPPDFPSVEAAEAMAEMTIGDPSIYGVVAEQNGEIVGSNFLWKHDQIAAVGPITIAPHLQSNGVGRKLMEDVIRQGEEGHGIRLVQDAFNSASLSLYAALGFRVVEPLVVIEGHPKAEGDGNMTVRLLEKRDVEQCSRLCRSVHGFDRANEMQRLSQTFASIVAERDGEIVAYASAPEIWQLNHAVAKTLPDMTALLSGAPELTGKPVSILLPVRQSELFRWALDNRMRVIKPMNLMAMGAYSEPRGVFLPSVLY